MSENANIRDGKMLKDHSSTTRNYAVAYFQALVEFGGLEGAKKLKKTACFIKILLNFVIIIDESYDVFSTLLSKAIGHFLSRKTSIMTIYYINFKNKIFNK